MVYVQLMGTRAVSNALQARRNVDTIVRGPSISQVERARIGELQIQFLHPTQLALLRMDSNWSTLPTNLPEPTDDGLADHLHKFPPVPDVFLISTTAGDKVNLLALSRERPVLLFIYPRTGEPGKPNPEGWDDIPGARGCTPELCSVRDSFSGLQALRPGINIFGLSTQTTPYQSEVAARLHLPYALLSDVDLEFTNGLDLPTFQAGGMKLLKRITLLLDKGLVTKVDYPIFPSDQAARRATELIRE